MELKIENLSKKYSKNVIGLKDFSYTFTPGIYGLLGANGAGKSTLMNCLCHQIHPTRGKVSFNGKDIYTSPSLYLRHIGYMPQQFCLYDEFTLFQNLDYMAQCKSVVKRKRKDKIITLSKQVGLDKHLSQKLSTFSGGMKQRAMFIQSIINDPDILFLDERKAGMDQEKRIELRNLISDFSKDKIVLLATHIVSDIDLIADTVLLMKDGKLIKADTPMNLEKSIEGNVIEISLTQQQIQEIPKEWTVSQLRRNQDKYIVRCVTRKKQESFLVTPNLEDVYLFYCKENL